MLRERVLTIVLAAMKNWVSSFVTVPSKARAAMSLGQRPPRVLRIRKRLSLWTRAGMSGYDSRDAAVGAETGSRMLWPISDRDNVICSSSGIIAGIGGSNAVVWSP